MAIEDIFRSFNETEYKKHTKLRATEELREHEVRKTRQIVAASASIGLGVGGAVFTGGASLAASAYGGRRLYIAFKKLIIIQDELTSRGVALHKFDKKDFFIPITAATVGAGIGFGLEELAVLGTNELMQAATIPTHGSATVSEAIQHPLTFLHGLGEGIQEQGHEIAFAANETIQGALPGSQEATTALAQATMWNSVTPAEAIGFHAGMLMATSAEKAVTALVGSEIMWRILESMEGTMKAAEHLPCRRMGGLLVNCDGCNTTIEKGVYYHCCLCDDDYDLCLPCYGLGKRCKNQEYHGMTIQQVVLSEDYQLLVDMKQDAYWLSDRGVRSRQDVRNVSYQASCDNCNKHISQGYLLHCIECSNVDICTDCYRLGSTCFNKYDHALTAVQCRLDLTKTPFAIQDCHRSTGKMDTKYISCEQCKRKITQGRYYHCCECLSDDFDICHSCYIGGKGCKKPNHALQLHLVAERARWKDYSHTCARGRRGEEVQYMRHGGKCDRCRKPFHSGYFYHCCQCLNDDFDMCSDCYSKGNGCDNINHTLSIHTIF